MKTNAKAFKHAWPARLPRIVPVFCLAVSLALIIALILWSVLVNDSPAPILPPAGRITGGKPPFTFAVIGDNRGNTQIFENILNRIKADNPGFILHTGDIVKRCASAHFNWILHELHEEKLPMPICFVPGNHDINEDAANAQARLALYNRAFGQRRYWFAYANALFVAFDDSTGRCGAEDLKWLNGVLMRHRNRYQLCFVYMHVPLRDPRPGVSHALHEGAEGLTRVLKKHRVSAVFNGHIHGYLEDNVDGVPVYITGGSGAKLDKPSDRNHYLVCTVEPGGAFRVRKRNVERAFNSDYPEYVLRADFPNKTAILFASAGFLAAGIILTRRAVSNGRDKPRHS